MKESISEENHNYEPSLLARYNQRFSAVEQRIFLYLQLLTLIPEYGIRSSESRPKKIYPVS